MATASEKNKKTKTSAKPKTAKKPAVKKVTAKKTTSKKVAPKKAAPKKAVSKKAATVKKTENVKKAAPKKTAAKKAAPKKAAVKKTPVKKKTAKNRTVIKTAAVNPATPQQEELHNNNMSMLFFAGLAVFAALSFGVFKSGRDGDAKDNERYLMTASHIVQYSVEARKKVAKLQEGGVALSRINFDLKPEEDDETALFAKAGGGLEYMEPLGTGGYVTEWRILGVSDARSGFLVSGLGSDAAVRGREVVMYFEGLEPEICSQMRKGWGLDPEVPVQEVKVDFDHRAANAAGANATTFYATPGREFSCFRNGRNGSYVYYHAIAVQ